MIEFLRYFFNGNVFRFWLIAVSVSIIQAGKPAEVFRNGTLMTGNDRMPKSLQLGQVSGISIDSQGRLHVFHRGSREWDYSSFDSSNNFRQKDDGPIKEPTHLILDSDSGQVLHSSGSNRFYMPHGLNVDPNDNIWLTDVALHQVFKMKPGAEEPSLTLGEAFTPGSDRNHFCMPADVAVSASGEVFVADGYCNSRIVHFGPDGRYIGQFGKPSVSFPPPPGTFKVPHSLALVDDLGLLCVADRENERIQCFSAGLNSQSLPFGTFIRQAKQLGRVFAIDKLNHFLVGVTNGKFTGGKLQLFTVNLENGDSLASEPGLENPHDIAVAQDGTIFVAEIGPNRILKLHL